MISDARHGVVGAVPVTCTLRIMTNRAARTALFIVGVIAVIVGAVFAGQGANLIPGSSMTGDRMWLYIGLLVALAGIIMIALGVRRLGRRRTKK